MKKGLPLVSVITINYNGRRFLNDCFKSLFNLNYPKNKLEIFLVDNGSTDNSLGYMRRKFPTVKIILNKENNYAKANNLGIKAAHGEYIALVNNDTRVDKDWLIKAVETAQNNVSIGAVGSKILFMDGSIESAGHQEYPNFYWVDMGFGEKDTKKYNFKREVASICGCSVLYMKRCLKEVGLLDEDFNMFMEDVDMGIRCAKKGWKLVTCPESIIYHKFHGTINNEDNARHWQEINRLLLIAKHWPEKLADALYGKGYFTAQNDYDNVKDIGEVLGKILVKLIKEHGLEFAYKLTPDLFKSVRKIYNFEKDYLIREIKNRNINIATKDQEIATKNQELSLKDQQAASLRESIESLKHKCDQELTLLMQQKEQELASLKQHKEEEMDALVKQKAQELSSLKQQKDSEMASLSEEKERAIASLMQQKEQELASLKQHKEEEMDALVKQKAQELSSLKQQKEQELENKIKYINEIVKDNVDKREKINLIEQEKSNLSFDLEKVKKELRDVYLSTGYRFLLKPLWFILWSVKQKTFTIKHKVLFLIKLLKEKHRRIFFLNRLTGIKSSYNIPKDVHLQITDRCNLKCRHCDIWKKSDPEIELNTREWKRIIDKLYKWLGKFNLHFCGGEPFMRQDLLEIIRYCSNKGIKTFVTTNFTLVDLKTVRKIIESGLTGISLSLDAIDNEKLKYLRAREGSFDRLKLILNEFKTYKQRPHITIASILMGYNLVDIMKLLDLCRSKTIFDGINLQPLSQNFNAPYNPKWYLESDLWPKDSSKMEETISCLLEIKQKEGIIDNPNSQLELMKIYFKNPEDLPGQYTCASGFNNLNITPSGQVLLCWNMKPIGNILSGSLENIWFSEQAKRMRGEIINCKRPCSILNCNYIRKKEDGNFHILLHSDDSIVSPESLIFTITTKCNFLCRQCEIPLIKDKREELSTEQIKQFIFNLHKWRGKFHMELTGGEPLLRNDIFEIINFSSRLDNIWIQMSSNGYLIDEQVARKIIDSGLNSIGISLDAMNPNIHDYIRNKKGAHSKAMEAIRLINSLRKEKMKLSIQAIIMDLNLDELEKLVYFAKDNKLSGASFQPIFQNFGTVPEQNWYKRSGLWPKDIKYVDSLLDRLIQIKNKNDDNLIFFNNVAYFKNLKKYFRNPNRRFLKTCRTDRNIYLSPYGDIMLCPFYKTLGNILEDDIKDIWFSKETQECRKYIKDCHRNCSLMMCICDE